MKYMPLTTLATWRRVKEEQLKDPSWDPQKWVLFDEIRIRLIRDLAREGHGILLGSDAPQIFNVPGASLHREISAMQRAGLTPAEILEAGTLNPARFFGEEDQWGSLEEGKVADFFLVETNPLEDLSALGQMTGLMLGGKWLSRDFIDQKLEEIAGNAAKEKTE
jgi:imidazolonepropionase-like amidohydrolase